ncbi:hypothetical protein ACHAXT_004366 [Thalassiosira profunda]
MADVPARYLTKSLVRLALKCPRNLVFATNPALYPRSIDAGEDSLLKHLAQEGGRFGEYCKRLFPHGVEIGAGAAIQDGAASSGSRESLVSQTQDMLVHGSNPQEDAGERVTIFEGALQHGYFYARPDILDKTIGRDGIPELKLIEVKSKSWDSRHSPESKLFTAKKSVKSTFMPYIQDVTFQKMVASLAYPDFRVSAWLMMPDRAKRMKYQPENEPLSETNHPASFESTLQTIDDSIATLINVDEAVEVALNSKVQYPGSKNDASFNDIVQKWAEELNGEHFGEQSFLTRVGPHCSACEYRPRNVTESTLSGFDACWSHTSGTDAESPQTSPPVVDLFGNAKVAVRSLLSEGKYRFSDLSRTDFDLLEEASKGKKKQKGGISTHQRMWYQVQSAQRGRDSEHQPTFIIRRNLLKQAMDKWRFPLHFIDFETVSSAIPYYENASPYDVSAFQFSHHTMSRNEDGSFVVEHASEFLHTDRGECPNIPFLKALHSSVGSVVADGGGTVFQWSPYENSVLRAMLASEEISASLSPEEFSALSELRGSLVDLCDIAQKYYYVDGSGGSSSMKRLLRPTLNASSHLKSIYGTPTYSGSNFTNMQWYQLDEFGNAKDPYDILSSLTTDQHDSAQIAMGGAAASAFNELQTNSDLTDQDRAAIEAALLRYCELDTLAMVLIVQGWQGFLNDEDAGTDRQCPD